MKSLILTGEMVIAALEELKTQTRRTYGLEYVNELPHRWEYLGRDGDGIHLFRPNRHPWLLPDEILRLKCPYGVPGDKLYAKETWATERRLDHLSPSEIGNAAEVPLWYKADNADSQRSLLERGKWRPAIFMPQWASRITLELTDVRVERLQEITEEDAIAEGFMAMPGITSGGSVGLMSARACFKECWDALNGKKYPWSSNPWVWVLSFALSPERSV